MKATMPIAYSFIIYLISIGSSFLFFKKAVNNLRKKQFLYGLFVLCIAGLLGIFALVSNHSRVNASGGPTDKFEDPLGPNAPIGDPKGIFPGRVVWIWDPDATNENCTNNNHSDAYWLDKNCDQEVVDEMFSDGIQSLTGKDSDAEAWNAIFRYFNINHGKGDTGYVAGEAIFIKINAVTAWSGAPSNGEMPPNLGIEYDTSPQTILAMLRQLVNVAGVPEEDIYIGDPMCDIFNNLYDKFYAEFPDINYVSQGDVTGRYKLTPSTETGITYSDHGTVMTEVTSHNFFVEMMNADYLLNIPTMKGHRWGGVTFFAKNHFGSNTADHSWELHKGLMKPDDDPLREGYGLYRVFVDLMSCKYLGGKTLLYYMDALWSTSYEHQKPQKYHSLPFNNDWCSSVLFSLDPVAIESVCLDIMQKEFTEEDLSANPPRYTYVQWDGVDDYLHQAASSDWWPEDITYDPDQTGSPIPSLGVHEHWNNVDDMQYSRNLGTGDGIELIKLFRGEIPDKLNAHTLENNILIYPNPCRNNVIFEFILPVSANVTIEILSTDGKLVQQERHENIVAGTHKVNLKLDGIPDGIYLCVVRIADKQRASTITEKLYVH
jgi:hypothetical protein